MTETLITSPARDATNPFSAMPPPGKRYATCSEHAVEMAYKRWALPISHTQRPASRASGVPAVRLAALPPVKRPARLAHLARSSCGRLSCRKGEALRLRCNLPHLVSPLPAVSILTLHHEWAVMTLCGRAEQSGGSALSRARR